MLARFALTPMPASDSDRWRAAVRRGPGVQPGEASKTGKVESSSAPYEGRDGTPPGRAHSGDDRLSLFSQAIAGFEIAPAKRLGRSLAEQ
jgi:hypothetical protein